LSFRHGFVSKANSEKPVDFGGLMTMRTARLVSALLLIVVSISIHSELDFSPGNWRLTHYYFSYESEFLKRALPGEVIRILTDVNEATVRAIILAAIAFLALVQCWSLFRMTKSWDEKDQALAVFFFLGCPAMLGHLVLDFGRYDVFLIALSLATILISAISGFWLALTALVLLQSLAILTHEIAIVTTVPVCLLALAAFKGNNAQIRGLIGAAAFLGCLAVFVFLLGGSDTATFDELQTLYADRYDGNVSKGSLEVLFRDLEDNVAYSAKHTLVARRIADNLFVLIIFTPFMLMTTKIISGSPLADRFGLAIILTAVFLPILLSFVGHDQFRWWSFIFTNLYILMWVCAFTSRRSSEKLRNIFDTRRREIFAVAVLFLFVGPLGVTQGFAIYH
jgi:hypothetical protein